MHCAGEVSSYMGGVGRRAGRVPAAAVLEGGAAGEAVWPGA